jgi:hypothetical protein
LSGFNGSLVLYLSESLVLSLVCFIGIEVEIGLEMVAAEPCLTIVALVIAGLGTSFSDV